ncbi:MAG: hypothetical protein AB7S26_33815 [Sandaracinaceae bacterium]
MGLLGCALHGCAQGAPGGWVDPGDMPTDPSPLGPGDARWILPETTRAAGQQVQHEYTAAGFWEGGVHCATMTLPGTRALGDSVYAQFGPDLRLSGLECAQSAADPALMSIKGTGRALDIVLTPSPAGSLNMALGDVIANYLVEHAGALQIQLVAWNGTSWNASYTGQKDAPITAGPAYRDRVHVELTPEGAGTPTASDDAAVPSDAGVATVDSGALPPCQGFRSVGYDVCVEQPGHCEVIFRDGAGCTSACARVGMLCRDSWNDIDGMCAPNNGEHYGCGNSGHTSDYCICEPP